MRVFLLLSLLFAAVSPTVYGQPANSTPANATAVTSLPFTDTGVNFAAVTGSFTYPSSDFGACINTFFGDKVVFYTYTPTQNISVEVTISSPSGGSNANIVIFYDSDDATLTQAEASAVAAATNPGNNCSLGRTTNTLDAVQGNTYYVLVANTSTSDVVFSEPALPVELADFAATTDGNRAYLAWQTASETNNAGFHIEHSTATGNWATLAFTPGHGTTLEAQRYTYIADGLAPGQHRFRLKQLDYDGAFAYSPEVEVSIELVEAFSLSEVYPNPFNPEASLTLSVRERQAVTVTVHDLMGREVARLYDGDMAAHQGQVLRLDGTGWPSGLYVVRAMGEHFTASQTITLLK